MSEVLTMTSQDPAEEQWREAMRGSGSGPWECGDVVVGGTLADAIAGRLVELRQERALRGREEADHAAAARYAPYRDGARVAECTAALVAAGETVFQPHLIGEDQTAHVRALLDFYAVPAHSTVLDAGCGVGGVAALMQALRPDLRFVMLNNSREQLELCPPAFERIHASFEAIPRPAESFDVVMFNFALGHARLERALSEASRVTKPGGLLLISDLCADDSGPLIVTMGYRAHAASRIREVAEKHAFELDGAVSPRRVTIAPSIAVLGSRVYQQVFGCAQSCLFRFTKCVVVDQWLPGARLRPAAVF